MRTTATLLLIIVGVLTGCSAPGPPPAWLIVGDTTVQATLYGSCYPPGGCYDMPDPQAIGIVATHLPPGAQAMIVIDSTSVTEFSVNIRAWSADFGDPAAVHHVAAEGTVEGSQTIFTLAPFTDTDDQLLYATATFRIPSGPAAGERGDAGYMWHLNPAP